MRREFASEFEPGECWGYNKYCRIDELIHEGYLFPETDTIILKFYVRPPTYRHLYHDQQFATKKLKEELLKKDKLIEEL